MKNIQITLHINPTVPPVAQPHRRIPYHLRAAVEKQIKQLLKLDVIEKVDGPTPWVSPIVCVPRPDPNDPIHICVDMRCANEAIQRERHITPTLEDILQEVNCSKYFTKIDLQCLPSDRTCRRVTLCNNFLHTFGTLQIQTIVFWHILCPLNFPQPH